MKKILYAVAIAGVVVGAAVLHKLGLLKWQSLTVLLAAIAAPFKFVMGLFGSEEDIRDKHAETRARENRFQEELERRVSDRDERIGALNRDIASLKARLDKLAAEKDALTEQVESMSVAQQQSAGKKLLGD